MLYQNIFHIDYEYLDLPSVLCLKHKPYLSLTFIIILTIEEKSPSFGTGFDREPGFFNEDHLWEKKKKGTEKKSEEG